MAYNVIWDFDGTLFDSYPVMVKSFCYTLEQFGIPSSEQSVLKDMRVSMGTAIKTIQPLLDTKGITTEQFNRVYRENRLALEADTLLPFEGALEICRWIVENGGKNFIWTHRGTSTQLYLDKFDFNAWLIESIDHSMGYERKPNPDAILSLVKRHSLIPEATIMIGDREIDLLAGRNAKVKTALFIGHGYDQLHEQIPSEHYDWIFNTFDEIKQIVGW